MKHKNPIRLHKGVTLVETILALGLLAVSAPMVFLTIGSSGKSGMDSAMETRAAWIVPRVVSEVEASRNGKSVLFGPSKAGVAFPSAGDEWALAFSDEGELLSEKRLTAESYQKGVRESGGKMAAYLAKVSGEVRAGSPLVHTNVVIEYPAAAPEAKRTKLTFHSCVR